MNFLNDLGKEAVLMIGILIGMNLGIILWVGIARMIDNWTKG